MRHTRAQFFDSFSYRRLIHKRTILWIYNPSLKTQFLIHEVLSNSNDSLACKFFLVRMSFIHSLNSSLTTIYYRFNDSFSNKVIVITFIAANECLHLLFTVCRSCLIVSYDSLYSFFAVSNFFSFFSSLSSGKIS